MPSIPASGPPERRGEGRRPVGPSAFASVRLPRSRHRFVPAQASYLRRSRLCAEPYARRRLPRSFLARRRPGWGEKAVAALRPFEIDRSLRHRSVPAPLRSGTASLRHRLRSSPEPSLRGASTLRSLCFAGASARSSALFRLRRHRLRSGTGSFLPGALSSPEPSPAAHVIRLTFLNRGQITNRRQARRPLPAERLSLLHAHCPRNTYIYFNPPPSTVPIIHPLTVYCKTVDCTKTHAEFRETCTLAHRVPRAVSYCFRE